jgi:prepilin-type N-terminal cleavage/methylation domain-containing protein
MKNGFSLVEIIIAICLLSVIAGLVSFRSTGMVEEVKLRTASRQIVSDLRAAQGQAAARSSETAVNFFREQYLIGEKTVKLPSRVWIFNPHAIKFSSNGTPVVGYFSAIQLKCGQKNASVIISPQGRIRVE